MFIDVIFALILVYACLKGYRKGFIVAVFSFIGFFIGLAAALKLSAVVAHYLSDDMGMQGVYLPFLSFLLVFLMAVILVNLIARVVQKATEMFLLGWLNRIGGILVYALFGAVFFSILLFYAIQLQFISLETVSNSVTYPFLQPLGPTLIDSLGTVIPIFKNLFQQLQDFFAGFNRA